MMKVIVIVSGLAMGAMTFISVSSVQARSTYHATATPTENTEECLVCHGPLDDENPDPVFPEYRSIMAHVQNQH